MSKNSNLGQKIILTLANCLGQNIFLYNPPQGVYAASYTVVGDSLWVMGGGDKDTYIQSGTQVVRQGQPTQWGPSLTEAGAYHCATTLQDNSVILTGGRTQSNITGSARTEVYNSSTGVWQRRSNMKQRRYGHSCTSVWVDQHPSAQGVIAWEESATAILSVVVAGGRCSSTPPLTLYPRILHRGRSAPHHLHCRDLPAMEGHLAGAPSPPCHRPRTQDGGDPHLLTLHG